jgi:hemerythrin
LELADFLLAWLVSHIVDEDKKIGAFVRDRKAG